jgi:cell division protein FtsB
MNDLYIKRKRLSAEYDRLAFEADWHGLTWALERQLDELVQEMNRVQEQIDELESEPTDVAVQQPRKDT